MEIKSFKQKQGKIKYCTACTENVTNLNDKIQSKI